jgi:hypothetical protein
MTGGCSNFGMVIGFAFSGGTTTGLAPLLGLYELPLVPLLPLLVLLSAFGLAAGLGAACGPAFMVNACAHEGANRIVADSNDKTMNLFRIQFYS